MKPTLLQSTQQTQTLFTEQISSLELLQMSTMELRAELEFALSDNPLLEVDSSAEAPMHSDTDETAAHTETEGEISNPEADIRSTDEPLEQLFDYTPTPHDDDGRFDIASDEPNYQEELLGELRCLAITPKALCLATCLVYELDSHGLLSASLSEVAATYTPIVKEEGFTATEDEWRDALDVLRRIGPTGIGASSTTEALLLQVQALVDEGRIDTLIQSILVDTLKHNLYEVAHHSTELIERRFQVSPETVQWAFEVLRSLHPYPIVNVSDENTQFVTPELRVDVRDGVVQITMLNNTLPSLRLVSQRRMAELRETIPAEQLQLYSREAKQLLYSVEARQSTLLRIATYMVETQKAFFLEAAGTLVSLRQKDIAQALGISESTVSRAIAGKYFLCAKGTLPLSALLVQNTEVDQIGVRIRAIVEAESRDKPLSDEAIAEVLNKEGFNVARRTVAKYREELGIPSTRQRRFRDKT